jgi:hypothetical protein
MTCQTGLGRDKRTSNNFPMTDFRRGCLGANRCLDFKGAGRVDA